MQKSVSSASFSSIKKTDFYAEYEMPPPPYKTEEESLPLYKQEATTLPSAELESLLNRFAPRWDDQRVQHCLNADNLIAEQMLDRMEDYRHRDQEWSSQDQIRLMQIAHTMYHSQHQQKVSSSPKKRACLLSAKSKYQKITLSIAKEREHLMKKIRSNHSLPKDDFDLFLNTISNTTLQSQMSNQRAMRMVATV
ncbi:hypothetical protein BC941DRAFT_470367 [Chlamydoabsidia padenii]|nr:hypothetical protein BC941DRAFT_470367 [Chlamydoabsidia padenii]